MDQLDIFRRGKKLIDKYKYMILIIAVGIFLMVLPSGKQQTVEQTLSVSKIQENKSISEELESILSQIHGVGRVQVMITESSSAETVYQTDIDEDRSEDDTSSSCKTVVISDNGEETGLVRTVTPPVYLGAVVVCQGGGDPSVRLAVSQAIAAVTGITTDRITVLKMK